jgi:hypothetical protein
MLTTTPARRSDAARRAELRSQRCASALTARIGGGMHDQPTCDGLSRKAKSDDDRDIVACPFMLDREERKTGDSPSRGNLAPVCRPGRSGERAEAADDLKRPRLPHRRLNFSARSAERTTSEGVDQPAG